MTYKLCEQWKLKQTQFIQPSCAYDDTQEHKLLVDASISFETIKNGMPIFGWLGSSFTSCDAGHGERLESY